MKFQPAHPHSVWRTGFAVTLATLAIFGVITGLVTFMVREEIQREIEDRDARAIYSLAQLELERTLNELEGTLGDALLDDFIRWEALLSTADYPGIIGIQLYSTEGELLEAVPAAFRSSDFSEPVLAALLEERPYSRFLGQQNLRDFLDNGDPRILPLLEVTIPLRLEQGDNVLGAARYLMEGQGIQEAFQAVDRQLMRQAGLAFLGGAALLVALLTFGFYRLHRAHALLHHRSHALIRANADLALAVKTNALGGIAAHLIHDLKNPLGGLKLVVESQLEQCKARVPPKELAYAKSAVQQMETKIREIAELLRDESQDLSYPLALHEFREIIMHKVTPLARGRDVVFMAGEAPSGEIESARANLLLLILYNLIQNAVEVTPPALAVTLEFRRDGNRLTLELSDHGPGIPEEIRERLFEPGRSRKSNGSGLGLAISRQLAYHIGASLALASTGPGGTTFEISLELAEPASKSDPVPDDPPEIADAPTR